VGGRSLNRVVAPLGNFQAYRCFDRVRRRPTAVAEPRIATCPAAVPNSSSAMTGRRC
jgi:hypothetical protein